MSDASPEEGPTGTDPIDRELARGFAQLIPPEDLMTTLLHAADATHPSAPSWDVSVKRLVPTALLLAAAAGVAFVVLGRGPDMPPEATEPASASPLTFPPGQRAVTLNVATSFVSEDDLASGAVVDLVMLQSERTVTLLAGVLVLHATVGKITIACTPADAEALVLGREHGVIVPIFHDGGQRLVTVPVDAAPIDAGFVARGMHTDLLATMPSEDGHLETVTLLSDVTIHRVHADGRVTLSVRPAEAERLLHASERGPLALSLRGN